MARPGDTESKVTELIDRLMRVTHALQFAEGLNPVQWEALRYVARANRDSCTPGSLADFLGTTKGTVSQTLISLETKGYLRRTRWKTDRRVVGLELTAKGRELLKKDPLHPIVEALSGLSEDSADALYDQLARVLRTMKDSCGIREFGYCEDCGYLILERGEDGSRVIARCGRTGEPIAEGDMHRICAHFRTDVA